MRPGSKHSRPPDDPLERARIASEDARDIARDELRRLPEYDDTEESTARHEVPVHVTVNLRDSQQELAAPEAPAKKQLKVGLAHAATLVGLALVTAAAGLLQNCHH